MSLLRRGIISSGKLGSGGIIEYSANTAQFNGSSKRFDPTSSITSGLSTFSFYARVKFDALDQDYIYFESTGTAGQSSFAVHMQPTGKILAGYRATTGGAFNTVESSILTTGTWYSLLVTIDVSSAIKIYINNSEDDSLAVSTGSIFGGVQTDVPTLGAYNTGGVRSNYFSGTLAFMGSNSRIITAPERSNLLTSDCYDNLGSLQTGIINYWELANWTGHIGQETTDQAGSNNLTNIGSTAFTGSGISVFC